MKIITKAIEKALYRQGDTRYKHPEDIKVIFKLFNPGGGQTWYIYEKIDDDIYMAFVNLGNADFAECGTISLSEIISLKLPMGITIERDLYFPIGKYSLSDVIKTIKEGGHI